MSDDRDPNDGASPEETELKQPSATENVAEEETEFHPFEELQDEFKPTMQKTIAEDGLPSVQDSMGDDDIPPLSPETLICMGVFTSFVKRNYLGEVVETYTPDQVRQTALGEWRVVVEEQEGEETPKKKAKIVEPIRPPCEHYIRQLGIGSGQVRVTYRLCAARRTTEGTFMSVRDTAVWACSMREPRDMDSERRHLDVFDERKMREGATRTKHSIFSGKGLG